jgi:acetyltransferase-like isoleucine patch superfamily enzyme
MRIYNGQFLSEKELVKVGFKKIGRNNKISKNVVIVGAENIILGSNNRIDSFATLSAGKKKLMIIGSYVHISSYTWVSAAQGLVIRDFVGLGAGSKIYSEIEDFSGESLMQATTGEYFKNRIKGPIFIGKHVGIGANSIIFPNVKIGKGACIGAMTIVNKDLEGGYVYYGVPARSIYKRTKKYLIHEKKFLNFHKNKQKVR